MSGNKSKVSQSSKQIYTDKINILKNNGIDNFSKPSIIFNFLEKEKYKDTSIRMYLTSIIYHVRNSAKYKKKDKESLIKEYNKYSQEKKKKIDKKFNSKKLLGREVANFVTWDKIVKMHKRYKNKNSTEYVLLSLYILRPPRRREYYNVVIKKSEPKKLNTAINYLILPKGQSSYFIFNKYKTSKTYGTQKLKNKKALDVILKKYIIDNKKKYGDNLLGLTSATRVSQILSSLFKQEINKNISVDILRHSYISWYLLNEEISNEKLKTKSYEMAHSVKEHITYIRCSDKN